MYVKNRACQLLNIYLWFILSTFYYLCLFAAENLLVLIDWDVLQNNFFSTTTISVEPVEPAQAQWDCGRSAVVSVEHSWQRLLGELAADGQSAHGFLLVFGELRLRDNKDRGASLGKVLS